MHWVSLITFIVLFALGLYMVELTYYDPWYRTLPDIHRSIGLCFFGFLCLRLIWRFTNPHPINLRNWSKLEAIASKWTHWLLYLLLFGTSFAGYLISTADGRGIQVFNLFEIPALFPSVKGMEDIAGEVHEYLAWSLVVLGSIHAIAALKHHFVDKDNTLKRMLKPQR